MRKANLVLAIAMAVYVLFPTPTITSKIQVPTPVTAVAAPVLEEVKPVAVAPAVPVTPPAPPKFNPQDKSTWPSCAPDEWVWADDGKCHKKPVEAPRTAQATKTPVTKTSGAVSNCGDNEYARYIYMKESGCRTNAINPIGCYGIGQSCPRSKIAHCGDSYTCQNAWFSQYAKDRYGGWAQAYQFWLRNHWW